MALPPWLNISPFDYLRAVQAGTQAGLSIREANERAFENAQRMEMERENQAQRQQQLAIENAANRLAQERLEAYRQGELKNAQARIATQQLGEQALQKYREAEAERAFAGLEETKRHNLADEATKNKPKPTPNVYRTAGGVIYKLDPISGAIPLTTTPVRPPPKDPVQGALLGADAATLRAMEREVSKRDAQKPTGLGALLHPGYQSDTDKLKATADELRKQMETKYRTGSKPNLRYNEKTGKIETIAPAPVPVGQPAQPDSQENDETDEEQ